MAKKKKRISWRHLPERFLWCPECLLLGTVRGHRINALDYDGEFVLMQCADCGYQWWSDQHKAYLMYQEHQGRRIFIDNY